MVKVSQYVFYIAWALWLLYLYLILILKRYNNQIPQDRYFVFTFLRRISKRWVMFGAMFLSTLTIFSLFFLLTRDFKSDANFFIEKYEYKLNRQQEEIIIGNSETDADIPLENPWAAERHLKMVFKGTGLEVQDISDDKNIDINGHYLNRATLHVGDEIVINGKERIKVLKIHSQFPLGRSLTVSSTRNGRREGSAVAIHTLLNKKVPLGERGTALLEYIPNKKVLGTNIYHLIVFLLVFLLSTAIYFYLQNHFNGPLLLLMLISLAYGAGLLTLRTQGLIMLLFLPPIVYVEKKRKTHWKGGAVLVILLYIGVFFSPRLLHIDGDFIIDYAPSKLKEKASIKVIPPGATNINDDAFELFNKRETLDYGKIHEIILGHTRYTLKADNMGVSLSPLDPEKIKISRNFAAITGNLSEVSPGNNYIYLKFPHDFESVPAEAIKDKEKITIWGDKGNSIILSKKVNKNYPFYFWGLIYMIVGPFWVFWGLNSLYPLVKKKFLKKRKGNVGNVGNVSNVSNVGYVSDMGYVGDVGEVREVDEYEKVKDVIPFNHKNFIIYNFVYFMLGLGYVVFGGLALYNNQYFKNFAKFRSGALPFFVVLFLGLLLFSRYNRFFVFLSRVFRQRKYQVPLMMCIIILVVGASYSKIFLLAAALFFIFVFGFRLRTSLVFEYKCAHSYPFDIKKLMETPVCSFEDKESQGLFFGLGKLLNKKGWNYLLVADLLLLLALFFILLQVFLGGELGLSVGGFLFLPIELGKILLAIYFADWVSRIDKGMSFNVLWVYALVLVPFLFLIVFLKDFSPLLIFVFVFFYHIIKIKKSFLFKVVLIGSALVVMKQAAVAFNNYTIPAFSFSILFSIIILYLLLRVWYKKKHAKEPGRYDLHKKIAITVGLVSLLLVGIYILYFGHVPVSRVLGDRISSWLNPWQDYNLSYQYINGLWLMKGTGAMGNGAEALFSAARVPLVEKDLSFSLYVSVLGTIGIILLMLTIFLAAAIVFRRSGTIWHGYVKEFLAVIFIAQFLVPAMYTVGLLPLMGQPIPFLSYSNNLLLLFTLPFSFLMFILATPSGSEPGMANAANTLGRADQKFLEVQEPFYKKVPGGHRYAFLIYCIILMAIAFMVLLRLYSISYPKDIEEKADIVYLESFHNYSSIFKLKLKDKQFLLTPEVKPIQVEGKDINRTVDIHNGDIITVGDSRFLFKVYPSDFIDKEIFCRPLSSVFPGPASLKYISGWSGANRQEVFADEWNLDLLKKTIVEIAPEELSKVVPGPEGNNFAGPILELSRKEKNVQVRPLVSDVVRIRDLNEKKFGKESVIMIMAGDKIKLSPDLYLKFDFRRQEGAQCLVISYRHEQKHPIRPEPDAAIIKSLDSGIAYDINLATGTLFMGRQGLFSFNLDLGELKKKLFIPNKVPQGRVMDLKELLDHRMYYRKGDRFFAVTHEFLEKVDNNFKKGRKWVLQFFEKEGIKWRNFKNYLEFRFYVNEAKFLMRKMENKGIYKTFSDEVGKLEAEEVKKKPAPAAVPVPAKKDEVIDKMFLVKKNKIYLVQKQARRPSFRKVKTLPRPVIMDTKGSILAYNSEINGDNRRFYAAGTSPDLLYLLSGTEEQKWALEQIFSRLYRENRIHEIHLTINQDWQKITLEAMRKILMENRETEISDPKYLGLKGNYDALKAQLALIGEDQYSPLRTQLAELKKEIDLEKNYFYEAAVVLMDPVGRVLTAASYPYDEKTLLELNPGLKPPYLRSRDPYLNRAWKWKYNPGSTAKIVDSMAFLCSRDRFPYVERLLTSGSAFAYFPRVDLLGSAMLNGKIIPFHLRNFQGHTVPPGFCSLLEAFTHSYNTYFAYLCLHSNSTLTVDSTHSGTFIKKSIVPITGFYKEYSILEYAERVLMNRQINLLGNLSGTPVHYGLQRMPNDTFMAIESVFPVNAYTAADVAHYAIGQGDYQLTALQNAVVASIILNDGALYFPSIVESIKLREGYNEAGQTINPDPESNKIQVIPALVAGEIKDAMQEVVKRGTAGGVFGELTQDRLFYAKTGTSETGFSKDNALFTGFVKFKNNKYVVYSVIVPRSGLGARIAGKLTAQIINDIITFENQGINPF